VISDVIVNLVKGHLAWAYKTFARVIAVAVLTKCIHVVS